MQQEASFGVWEERPRERLFGRGSESLDDAELLAVLLGTGHGGANALQLARELLRRCDGLAGMLSLEPAALLDQRGLGPAKVATLLAALEVGKRCARQPLTRRPLINRPAQTREFLAMHLGLREREVFSCLFLDAQHRLLRCEDLFFGTIDGAAVYPREVVTRALRHRAAAVIAAHNHPSGMVIPSEADKALTRRLKSALGLVDVRLLDHVIVGRGAFYSFAESGLL
ncbi:MAG: DNA repair protein RadC [Pseudomonadota bacterium]